MVMPTLWNRLVNYLRTRLIAPRIRRPLLVPIKMGKILLWRDDVDRRL